MTTIVSTTTILIIQLFVVQSAFPTTESYFATENTTNQETATTIASSFATKAKYFIFTIRDVLTIGDGVTIILILLVLGIFCILAFKCFSIQQFLEKNLRMGTITKYIKKVKAEQEISEQESTVSFIPTYNEKIHKDEGNQTSLQICNRTPKANKKKWYPKN